MNYYYNIISQPKFLNIENLTHTAKDLVLTRLLNTKLNSTDQTKLDYIIKVIENALKQGIGVYVVWREGCKPNGKDWAIDFEFEIEKAKEQFKQVPMMLQAFEHWFGPYPFYEDGFKLVQSPHLGMEHQSAVAYGNGFQNGYRGRDLSGSGYGLKWDFIIVHESGHEWFANNSLSRVDKVLGSYLIA